MGIDAFVIWYDLKNREFAEAFLGSPDFDLGALQSICQEIGLPYSGQKKNILVARILNADINFVRVQELAVKQLIIRNKSWASLKLGDIPKRPSCRDAKELIVGEGEEEWYGPVIHPGDKNAFWYIRPIFVKHWATPPTPSLDESPQVESFTKTPQQFSIRWLCFARIWEDTLSVHWRGFSHAASLNGARQSQFQYWEHIPKLFKEIERLTGARVEPVKLHHLVLYTLWDKYRYDAENFNWEDVRIRAESGGVSLNARAGAVELKVGGIRRLANIIRNSIEIELLEQHKMALPKAEKFDEVILRTLIRGFGALSYEFSLADTSGNNIFRAHSYFGAKNNTPTQDGFPHLNFHLTWGDDLGQLNFLIKHLRNNNANEGQLRQISLF